MPDDANSANTRPTAMAPDASTSPVEWSRPIEAVSVTGEIIPARWRWRDDADDELGVRFVTTAAFGWPFRDNGEPREPFDGTVWRIRNVQPTTPERDPALWDRMVSLVEDVANLAGGATYSHLQTEARAIKAVLSPPDPDLIVVRQMVADAVPGIDKDKVLRGGFDDTVSIKVPLACLKRGRELATPEVSHVG